MQQILQHVANNSKIYCLHVCLVMHSFILIKKRRQQKSYLLTDHVTFPSKGTGSNHDKTMMINLIQEKILKYLLLFLLLNM